MKSSLRFAALSVAVGFLAAGTALAGPILVNGNFSAVGSGSNGQFTTYDLPPTTNGVPGWTASAGTATGFASAWYGQITDTSFFNYTPAGWGGSAAYTNGPTLSQTVDAPASGWYTFSVEIGAQNANGGGPNPGWPATGWADIVIGSNTYDATGTLPSNGNWALFTTGPVYVTAGTPIEVNLGSSPDVGPYSGGNFGGIQGDFAGANLQLPEGGSSLIYLLLAGTSYLGALVFISRKRTSAVPIAA